MTNDLGNYSDDRSRTTLRALYDRIPQRLAETEEPFDVEAGLDQINAWIDGQAEPAVPSSGVTRSADQLTNAIVLPAEGRERPPLLAIPDGMTPEMASRLLAIEEKRLRVARHDQRLERSRIDMHAAQQAKAHRLELARLDHDLKLRRLELDAQEREAVAVASKERDVELAGLETRRTAQLRSMWSLRGPLTLVAVAVAYAGSFALRVPYATLALSAGLGVYLVVLAVVALAAALAADPDRRHDAARTLRIMLLRDQTDLSMAAIRRR